jgi:hypothetical protein
MVLVPAAENGANMNEKERRVSPEEELRLRNRQAYLAGILAGLTGKTPDSELDAYRNEYMDIGKRLARVKH